ncbi:MAG: hypothetical protein ACI398_07680 [Clostridium sp.]
MTKFKRKYLYAIAFSVFSLFALGCSSAKEIAELNVAEDIELNPGAVLKSENGSYSLYDYNDKYIKHEPDKVVLTYDKNSGSYIYRDNNDTFAVYDHKQSKIENEDYIKLKLSPGGEYYSYFVEDNGMKLKVFKLKDNEELEINSNVSISGIIYDWYDNNSIIYYGVSDDGINGIFINNMKENKEELLYKIKEGYVAYLKATINNILLFQLDFENKRQLLMIDKSTKNVEVLNNDVEEIKDAVALNDDIFFVGRIKDNVNSIYKITNGDTKRVVYDFPAIIDMEKGIKIDKNGNILFVGSNEINGSTEQLYKYSSDGSISSISDKSSDYAFVDYSE